MCHLFIVLLQLSGVGAAPSLTYFTDSLSISGVAALTHCSRVAVAFIVNENGESQVSDKGVS